MEKPEFFWRLMTGARERGLQVSGPNSQVISSLVLGGNDVVVAAADYLIFKEIERGEPLAMLLPPSGCPVSLRPVVILKGARNQAAAGQFVQFCFSRGVQERVAATHLIPADPAVPVSPLRAAAPPLKMLLADTRAAQAAYREVLRRFRYEVEFSTHEK
jgi:ABC-type Fe3+ transport system substrate-binding protein